MLLAVATARSAAAPAPRTGLNPAMPDVVGLTELIDSEMSDRRGYDAGQRASVIMAALEGARLVEDAGEILTQVNDNLRDVMGYTEPDRTSVIAAAMRGPYDPARVGQFLLDVDFAMPEQNGYSQEQRIQAMIAGLDPRNRQGQ
jgi:hypothetical protein